MMPANSKNGGKYIYEGSYGCAFYPALPCKQNIKNKGLGKVFNNIRDFKQEEKIQKIIQKIDPKHEATIPYYGSCRVDINSTKTSDEVQKCNIISDYGISESSFYQLMFKFGGDDLDKILNEMKKNTIYASNTKTNKYNAIYFDTFITTLLPILKCILKIAYYGYSHSDIKPPNILYNMQNNHMYLIDFGLLQKQNYITHNGSILSFKYLYYPPEFTIMYSLRLGIRDPELLYNSILENFEFYEYENYMTFLDFATYKRKLKTFITYALSISLEKLEKEFLKVYIKKLDIYSLGMSLAEMIYVMKIDNTFKIHNIALYEMFIKNILIDIIHPDPRYRLTPDEAYIKMNCVYRLQKIKVQDTNIVKYLRTEDLKSMLHSMKLPIPMQINNTRTTPTQRTTRTANNTNENTTIYKNIIKSPELLIKI